MITRVGRDETNYSPFVTNNLLRLAENLNDFLDLGFFLRASAIMDRIPDSPVMWMFFCNWDYAVAFRIADQFSFPIVLFYNLCHLSPSLVLDVVHLMILGAANSASSVPIARVDS